MFTLITEVVASAAALGGGSRRGVGVLLSVESREPQDDGRRDVHLGYRARRENVSLPRQTERRENQTRLPAVLKIPGSCQQGRFSSFVPSNL